MNKLFSTLSILVSASILIISCSNARKIECENLLTQANVHINNYYFTHSACYLDSALIVLKQLGNKSKEYKTHIASREMFIYYELKEWDKAIDAVDRMDLEMFEHYVEMKKNFKNKILAKSVENDINERNRYYNAIIETFESIIKQNNLQIRADLVMDNIEDIQNSQTDYILSEMFYYKALVNGKDAAVSEIDSLQQKTSGNPEYFNDLKNIILKDKIHISLTGCTIER